LYSMFSRFGEDRGVPSLKGMNSIIEAFGYSFDNPF
jgi:hypothetical protein